jgi:hypothetical protein
MTVSPESRVAKPARLARRLALLAVAAATATLCVPSAGATAHEPHGMKLKGGPHASSTGNLIDHGGPVLAASHTYAVFWGSQSAWSPDVPSGIATLLGGFNGSNYLGISQQYMRGASISSAYEGAAYDSSTPPKKVSAANLGTEVQKLYGSNLDPNALYLVYTSNFPKGGGFCAWHSDTTVGGTTIQVAYMPNTGLAGAGCDPGNLYGVSGSEDLRSLANVTAHEYSETVTDPQLNAWYDSSGSEIGDKCAWQFSGPVRLSNGSVWQLQEEWSNAASGCVQGG